MSEPITDAPGVLEPARGPDRRVASRLEPLIDPRSEKVLESLRVPQPTANLRALTPARVSLRRAGQSLATSEVLDFQLAHARARDAVHAALQPATLLPALREATGAEVLALHSAAPDRLTYLQRPDLGRMLDQPSRQRLLDRPMDAKSCDLAIVIADGLSALAVERHATLVLAALLPLLQAHSPAIRMAPICVVEQGRVAIGDEVAALLNAALVIVLIGERPGLSSPDSLGAYITWLGSWTGQAKNPRRLTDAERNCVSNIRSGGLSYARAGARLLFYINQAHQLQLTGVAMKDPDTDPVPEVDDDLSTATKKQLPTNIDT